MVRRTGSQPDRRSTIGPPGAKATLGVLVGIGASLTFAVASAKLVLGTFTWGRQVVSDLCRSIPRAQVTSST